MVKFVRFLPALFCVALISAHATAQAQTNFGSVAVGSSTSATVTVTVPSASSFTAINVVTWGASGLDFTALSGGTCATGVSYGAGQTCTVKVSFTPQYAGLRMGAVTLANPSNNSFATTFLKGTGTAPQLAFVPGTVTAIYPTLDGYPLAVPSAKAGQSGGVAIDGNGTLYIASKVLNSSGTNIAQGGILQVPSGSSVATLLITSGDQGDTLTPTSVRVDGAGDRIVNDDDYTISLPPSATVGTENTIGGFSAPAVDGAGDIYLYQSGGNAELAEYLPTMFDGSAVGPVAGGVVSTNGYGLQDAIAQAVDPAGDVFFVGQLAVQDSSNEPTEAPIVEVTASELADTHNCCGSAQPIKVTANGVALTYAADAAFDGAGNLFLADILNNRIVEVPVGGGAAFAISPIVDGKGLSSPESLAVDTAGNLYIFDQGNSRIVKINRSLQGPLSFASASVGTTSSDSPQTVVVQNAGSSAVTFTSIVFPADFPQDAGSSSQCSTTATLAPGATCNLSIDFKPQSSGSLSESITVTDNTLNQAGSTQTISVSGTGTADAITFSATSLSFGSEAVGYSTATQTVTLTNHGSAITFSSIALTGANAAAFVSSNTCGTTLAANATCSIGVRFVPTATGAATASVTLTDNAANSPQNITLTGTGVTAQVASLTLSASSLAFGSEPDGSSTASQNVTVTNTSSNTLYFNSIALTGASAASFVTSNTCGASLAAGATCRIGVRFAPKAGGAASASVTLIDNASTSPQSISLSGTGIPLTLSPASFSFGLVDEGNESPTEEFTVTNTSNATVNFTSIALTGTNASSFPSSNNCGTSLAAGANCQVSVTFDPNQTGNLTAAVTLSYSASTSPQVIALSGTGELYFNYYPSALSFGNEPIGYSATQTVNVDNFNNVPINFTSISVSGPNAASFTITKNTCGASLTPAQEACQVNVRFLPTALGAATASLIFVDNGTNSPSPQTVPLSGTGITAPAASLSLSSSSLSFGNESVGTSTATQNVTVTNTSSVVLYFKSITLGGANASSFVSSNNCGASLAAGASCHVGARFAPTTTGSLTAAVTLTDNTSTSPQTIALSGTGTN